MNSSKTIAVLVLMFNVSVMFAEAESFTQANEQSISALKSRADWGIAIGYRSATVPYANVDDDSVTSLVPMMFYQGEYIYLDGLEAGIHLWKNDDWQVNSILRTRFFDIPAKYQNAAGGDVVDAGIQIKRKLKNNLYAQTDFMADDRFRFYGIATFGNKIETPKYDLDTYLSARYSSSRFNSMYYGFENLIPNGVGIDSGFDFSIGFKGRYHVISNFYLLGAASATYLNQNVRQASTVDESWQTEIFAGFGFFSDPKMHGTDPIDLNSYLRISHGFGTPSNMGDILFGNTEKDPYDNQLSSIFYGYPLTDELFNLPIDVYLTSGVVWHWSSEVQDSSIESVAAIKAYYTVNWPFQWRVGIAEGLSYITDVTYIEETELTEKGYKPNKLLNYMDISFDVNLGDAFNLDALDDVWFGYSMHHRSAIFEKSSQFGRMKGGSNYNTLYVQFDI